MREHRFTVVIEPDGEDFHAFAPALPGCHSFGRSIAEATEQIREAIALHVEAMIADGEELPAEPGPLVISSVSVALAS